MKELSKTKKQILLLVVGAVFLLAWMIALVFVIRDTFFVDPAVQMQEDSSESLYLAGAFSDRKTIYDRNFNELAVTFKLTSVYVRPLEISNPDVAAGQLAAALGLDAKELLLTLKSERSFVWLGRHLTEEKAAKIRDLNMQGVYQINEAQRYYPQGKSGAHVIGFTKDEQGLAGVESYYDSTLRQGGIDKDGFDLQGMQSADLVLSLDLGMQKLVAKKLAALMQKTKAVTGSFVVMQPATGKILAMANLPDYNPNDFWNYSNVQRRNRAVDDLIYPGGIGRIFRLATAFELGRQPASMADDGANTTGSGKRGKYWIKVRDEAYVSPELALPFAESVSDGELADFAFQLGFNQKCGIDLPIKGGGMYRQDVVGGKSMRVSAQEQSTTAVHLLTGFSRLINGGRDVLPHVLSGYWDDKSGFRSGVKDQVKSSAILPATGSEVLSLLKKSAELGPGASVVVESLIDQKKITAVNQEAMGIAVGKDTAEEVNASPSSVGVFHSVMMGMAPAHEPVLSFVVVLDNAHIDLQKPSPARRMIYSVIRKMTKLALKKDSRPSVKVLRVRENEIHARWQKILAQRQRVKKIGPVQDRQNGRMPDVRGASLRKALQVLQAYGLDVEVRGSGQVVGQVPGPGKKINKRRCVLELQVMQ